MKRILEPSSAFSPCLFFFGAAIRAVDQAGFHDRPCLDRITERDDLVGLNELKIDRFGLYGGTGFA